MNFKALNIFTLFTILIVGPFAMSQQLTSNEVKLRIENRGSSEERFVRRLIPQAAIISSDYRGSDAPYYANRPGFSVGALFDFGPGYNLVGESGVLYRQFSAATQGELGGSVQYTNNYLALPLTAKYYFGGQENTSLYLKAGLMMSTLVSQTANTSAGYSGPIYDVNNRNFELSALGALGGKFYLSPQTDLVIEGAYSRATDSWTNASGIYNAAWNVSAGLAVNL